MSDHDLFTTVVDAPAAQLMGELRTMLQLPWQAGAEDDVE